MNVVDRLQQTLFGAPSTACYGVLDGASVPDLLSKFPSRGLQYQCLYRGKLAPDLAEAAPYLVRLEQSSPFTQWLLKEGWGYHWGILAVTESNQDFQALRKHFRTFLMVESPRGEPWYFRYYDPRVLGVILPVCDEAEQQALFGPVARYVMEDDHRKINVFESPRGSLPMQTPRGLKLRTPHMEALNAAVAVRFAGSVAPELLYAYPKETESYTPDALNNWIRKGMDRAQHYGVTVKPDAYDFIVMLLLHGDTFELRPENRWALDILSDHDLMGGTKILQLQTGFQHRSAALKPRRM